LFDLSVYPNWRIACLITYWNHDNVLSRFVDERHFLAGVWAVVAPWAFSGTPPSEFVCRHCTPNRHEAATSHVLASTLLLFRVYHPGGNAAFISHRTKCLMAVLRSGVTPTNRHCGDNDGRCHCGPAAMSPSDAWQQPLLLLFALYWGISSLFSVYLGRVISGLENCRENSAYRWPQSQALKSAPVASLP